MPLLMDEDDALKDKLSGFTVLTYGTDKQTPIQVYFRMPDDEVITRHYPHIAIDLVDIEFDTTRMQRGMEFLFNYDTEQATPPSGFTQMAYDYPIPLSLVYQLVCYSRQPRHDRQMASLLFQMFPAGFGCLNMANYDGTIRRADFVSSVRRDIPKDADGKRTYRNIFTIAVSSEFLLGQISEIQQVTGIVLDIDLSVFELPQPA